MRIGNHTVPMTVAASAAGKEGYAVKKSGTAGQVALCSAATDRPFGIIASVSEDGLKVDVALQGSVVRGRLGAAVAAATVQNLEADADGKLVPFGTGASAGGGAFTAAQFLGSVDGADDDLVEVLVYITEDEAA